MIRLYRSWWAWLLAGLVIAPLLPFPLGIVVGGPLAMRGGWLLAGHVGQPCGLCGTTHPVLLGLSVRSPQAILDRCLDTFEPDVREHTAAVERVGKSTAHDANFGRPADPDMEERLARDLQQERIRVGRVRGHSDDDQFCHCPGCLSCMVEDR